MVNANNVCTYIEEATIDLLKKMMDEESELITIYYGEEGTKEDAEKIADFRSSFR